MFYQYKQNLQSSFILHRNHDPQLKPLFSVMMSSVRMLSRNSIPLTNSLRLDQIRERLASKPLALIAK